MWCWHAFTCFHLCDPPLQPQQYQIAIEFSGAGAICPIYIHLANVLHRDLPVRHFPTSRCLAARKEGEGLPQTCRIQYPHELSADSKPVSYCYMLICIYNCIIRLHYVEQKYTLKSDACVAPCLPLSTPTVWQHGTCTNYLRAVV